MRILTVKNPWAWAIIHGGKDIENRIRNIAGSYRGPVAIHVGLTWAGSSYDFPLVTAAHARIRDEVDGLSLPERESEQMEPMTGHIVGVVDLVDVHQADAIRGCWRPADVLGWVAFDGKDSFDKHGNLTPRFCSNWGETDAHHLQLSNPRALAEPIPFKGALGMRTLDDAVAEQIERQLATTAKEADR